MTQKLTSLIHAVEAIVGIALIVMALFLYDAEEQRLEAALKNLWVAIDNYEQRQLSKQVNFMRVLAKLITSGLDRLLGEKPISIRLCGVAYCYSFASVGLCIMAVGLLAATMPLGSPILAIVGAILFLAGIVYGTAPILIKRTILLRLWAAALALFGGLILLLFLLLGGGTKYLLLLLLGTLLVGVYLALARAVFHRMVNMVSLLKIIPALLINCAPLAVWLFAYVYVVPSISGDVWLAVAYLGFVNSIPALASAGFFFLALVLLSQHFVLQPVQRSLYVQERLGRKKVFGGIGIALIIMSGIPIPDPIKEFVKGLVK